jgi:replicative DNA helicase
VQHLYNFKKEEFMDNENNQDFETFKHFNPQDAAQPEQDLAEEDDDDFDPYPYEKMEEEIEEEIMAKKPAPKGIDLEMFILGNMFLDPYDTLDYAFEHFHEADFTLPIHGKIFAAMQKLDNDKKEIDILSVCARLPVENIHEILTDLIRTARSICKYYGVGDGSSEAPIDVRYLYNLLFNFQYRENYSSASYFSEKMLKALENKNGLFGISSGLEEFDFRIGGLCKGNLIIVGGRPSQGKTAFVINLARTAALNGSGVFFFSLQHSGRC